MEYSLKRSITEHEYANIKFKFKLYNMNENDQSRKETIISK